MRWKLFSVMVLLVLLASFVSAAVIEIEPIKNTITVNQEGLFKVTIGNDDQVSKTYKLFSLESGWQIDPEPANKIFELKPGETRTTTVRVKPSVAFNPGIYALTLYIDEYRNNVFESHPQHLKIYLSPDKPSSYNPSLNVKIDMVEKIDPNEPLLITLDLENRNPLNLSGLRIRTQSEMINFDKEVVIDLPPLAKTTQKLAISPHRFQQPKDYRIFFIFEWQGEQIKVVDKLVEVVPLYPVYEHTKNIESLYLKNFVALKVLNPGNVKNEQVVHVPTTFFESLFAQGVDNVVSEDGQRYLTWTRSISPGEEIYIHYVINYRLGLYLLILAIAFTIFYLVVRSPVSLYKKGTSKHSGHSETLSEIKIILEVRNKTNKAVRDVEIIDIVPSIANVEKSLELGTLKPKEIRNTKQGTKVIWSIVELDAHEHRLITYKIKAKLNILGTFSLPRASLVYAKAKGKKRKAYSNIYRLQA